MTSLKIDPIKLKEHRLDRALTQSQLSSRAAIHPITLSRIENGSQSANISTIASLARALKVKPAAIAYQEER